jgi:hypothetical protein
VLSTGCWDGERRVEGEGGGEGMLISRALGICVAAWFGCCVVGAAEAVADTVSFTTAGCSAWTVTGGVTSVRVQAVGAAGGGLGPAGGAFGGGTGDGMSATVSALALGQKLDVCVDYTGGGGTGGVLNGFAGGGASGVGAGSDFSAPLVVAGGGGVASAGGGAGGGAGLPAGAPGSGLQPGGQGGTATAPGAGAGGGGDGAGFTALGPGTGGDGASAVGGGGGGGGAGYFGGGGGAACTSAGLTCGKVGSGGGGGGGSDFCAAAAPVTGCSVSPGAGTSTEAGSAAGSAQVTLTYSLVPVSKEQCKNGGWQYLTDSNGKPFKNQGDCVSYVATGGKNAAG